MEYLVMECGLSYAVVLDQDGRILKVPNLGYTVGQSLKDVVLLPERPVRQQVLHKRIARWSALAACLCLLLLGSWVWQSPIGTVRMQINPDVLLSVNRFDRVVALEGLNEDGTALIDGYRAYGQEMKTVSDELADEIQKRTGGEVRVTVPGHTQRGGSPCPYDRVFASRLGAEAGELILKGEYGFMVGYKNREIVKVPLADVAGKLKMVSPDSDIVKEAKLLGISFGD